MPITIQANTIPKHMKAEQGDFVWHGESLYLCFNSVGEFIHLESGTIEYLEPHEYIIETRNLQIICRGD